MSVFRIWTTMKNKYGQIYWDIEYPSTEPDELVERLNGGALIVATHLWTRRTKDEEGKVLEVFDRRKVAFRRDAVQSIEIPKDRFVEYREDAPA